MGTVGVQVEDFHVDGLEAAEALYPDNEVEGGGCATNQCQQEWQQSDTLDFDDADVTVIQTKLFKRRRRANAVLDGGPERGLPPKCCDRCKSDLNGKLMVRCSTCSFRCHLYCFSPPLKQHPAFLIRRQQQNPQNDPNDSSSIWKCKKCEGTSVVFNVKPRLISSAVGSPKKTRSKISPQKRKCDSETPATSTAELQATPSSRASDTESGRIQSVQPQWIENSKVVFDWYRFRSEKAQVLRCHETDPSQTRSGVADLVFYSKTYAMMKKTAATWRAHVMRRRRFRHQQELETKATQYPDKNFDVMHVRKPNEKLTVEVHEEDLNQEDGNLVGINNQYTPYSRRRPRLPLLWESEAPSALMCWTTGERVEIADVLKEIEERVCLATEDVDAPSPKQENTAQIFAEADIQHDIGPVNVHAAATIIQTLFARHRLRRRRIKRANRQRRALDEAQRRAKARSSIALLRTCIQFIVVLMKMLGQARTKKAMLLVLRDAAEESRVKNDRPLKGENDSEAANVLDRKRKRQLAEVRIRRFFVRRVHPYVKIKKNVMARRLQRWWKRTYYPHKWREAALAVRLAHRNEACTRIQRLYRHFRVQSRFRALTEKHALKKLRRTLTRWLFSRHTKKEASRCALLEATQLTAREENQLPENAPLDEILKKRGMALYHQGDFWNAAFILERLCEMKKGKLTQELQQALAYAHHMTWYTSYDQFNLTRAHELYCSSLETPATRERAQMDPLVLQDLAIVMMHMEHFGDSLRLLAKLIEFFARRPQFPLWLLLAAVQLQQKGEWEQSVGYLTYLHDIPPTPYLERDILALVAMGYEQLANTAAKGCEARNSNVAFAKEAWRAALRQWNLKKISDERPGSASIRGHGRALITRQKWELLTDLGHRALEQGHYLLARRVYLYALELEGHTDQQEKQTAWWNLADAFRHLGHLDLYLNAALRSQSGSAIDEELQKRWQELAEEQTCSFQTELKTLTVLEKLRQLNSK
ncbi:hypothetical protein PHYPSEUDO_001883 [Phytophthora pseudosyringae]|uniref:Zinc finger PHD-type domain-containing protein n=1 Tax=Phytophthora pseudosyringae TaxID=221518 RepID=A0A8T1WJF2_9STRA|nr:hypothetical protein PHYPSEUDO_001883 [Phytophthora pseudosyringae]